MNNLMDMHFNKFEYESDIKDYHELFDSEEVKFEFLDDVFESLKNLNVNLESIKFKSKYNELIQFDVDSGVLSVNKLKNYVEFTDSDNNKKQFEFNHFVLEEFVDMLQMEYMDRFDYECFERFSYEYKKFNDFSCKLEQATAYKLIWNCPFNITREDIISDDSIFDHMGWMLVDVDTDARSHLNKMSVVYDKDQYRVEEYSDGGGYLDEYSDDCDYWFELVDIKTNEKVEFHNIDDVMKFNQSQIMQVCDRLDKKDIKKISHDKRKVDVNQVVSEGDNIDNSSVTDVNKNLVD